MDRIRKTVWISAFTACILSFCICRFPAWAEESGAEKSEIQWETLMSKVVNAYQEGKYAEGIQFAEAALSYAKTHFGAEDPKTLTSMNNLGMLYHSQGLIDKAEPLYENARRIVTVQLKKKIKRHHFFLDMVFRKKWIFRMEIQYPLFWYIAIAQRFHSSTLFGANPPRFDPKI